MNPEGPPISLSRYDAQTCSDHELFTFERFEAMPPDFSEGLGLAWVGYLITAIIASYLAKCL